jgi:dienelactone hydrolase
MRCTVVALVLLVACGGSTDPDLSVEGDGPHGIGMTQVGISPMGAQRPQTLTLLYPNGTSGGGGSTPIEWLTFEPRRGQYLDLLNQTPASCATRTVQYTPDVSATPGVYPLVLFSHCHECTEFSSFTVARRLASHGFFVAAIEHTGNTLWDQLAGGGMPLDTTTLEVRVTDLENTVAYLRQSGWASSIDFDHVGVFGHSFGSVTAGLYAQRNGAQAVFGLAAPMENPLLPGVRIAQLAEPLGFLIAREDNSISELGNTLIRNNFAEAPGDAWKIEVADAGHWSVSDIVGVVDGFAAGCGDGVRQTDGQRFTYLDAATGRGIAASYVTAFFKATLQGDAGARAYLAAARPESTVTVESR